MFEDGTPFHEERRFQLCAEKHPEEAKPRRVTVSPGFYRQKNCVDIPGATAVTFNTPASTMWDIVSEYLCVVMHAAGEARSRPGVIQVVGGARACDVVEGIISARPRS